MNRLEKLKSEKGEEEVEANCEWSYNSDEYIFGLDMWHLGFDAASAEYEKIIAELEGALEEIAIEQEFYIKTKDYFSEVVRLNLTAKEALQKLKEFRGGE